MFLTILLLSFSHLTQAVIPIAVPQLKMINPGGYEIIRLKGIDSSSPELQFHIAELPRDGSLFQLSQVFSSYGYEPIFGDLISMSGTIVTGSDHRIIYRRPHPDVAKLDLWDTFSYYVHNGNSASFNYSVTLVPPSGIIVASDFLLNNENWLITGNSDQPYQAKFEPFSRGEIINHYIIGADDKINKDQDNLQDKSLWYFKAPAKFLENKGISYGGSLTFSQASFAGNFDQIHNLQTHLVILECSECIGPVGMGLNLAFPISALKTSIRFDGSPMQFSVGLHETAGWLKDPQNMLKQWIVPSKCDMIQVLSRLSSIRILGDWTTSHEIIALDNVQITNLNGQIPICALNRPDASVCDNLSCK